MWKNIDLKEYMVDASAAKKEEKDFMEKVMAAAKQKSVLHSVTWHRIILDEAHTIKDKSRSNIVSSHRISFDLIRSDLILSDLI